MKIHTYNQEIQENNQENENDIKKEIKRNQKESSGMETGKKRITKVWSESLGEKKNSGPEIIFNTLISENSPEI